jgi:hypothetical protein
MKTDVMYLQKVTSKKTLRKKNIFVAILSAGSGSVPKCHGSTTLSVLFASGSNSDPDPQPWTKALDLFRQNYLFADAGGEDAGEPA